MRALDNNHNIHVLVVEDHKSIGIDTPEDLENLKYLLSKLKIIKQNLTNANNLGLESKAQFFSF